MKNSGLSAVLCNAGSGAIHHHYFGCPICGAEVGGFTAGCTDDDWGTHKDNFCRKCGQKINWDSTKWSDIYQY